MLRIASLILKGIFILLIFSSCEPAGLHPDEDNAPPKAKFYISPDRGDTTVTFVLDGHSSTDSEDINLFLEYRWDLNGDSIWDTEFVNYPYFVTHFPKPGTYTVRMEVRDRYGLSTMAEAKVTTWGMNNDTSHFIDPRDGQEYKTVRIKGVWWMAENLNFGTMIPDTAMATDNGLPEKYCYLNDPTIRSNFGGYDTYYHWDELMEYDTLSVQGLCPPGWRVPDLTDWDSLLSPFGGLGLITYFAEGGYSRLNLTRIGIHELTKPWNMTGTYLPATYWMYFTRDFEIEYYRGKYQPCPFLCSSSYFYKGNDNTAMIRFVNDSIREYGGALPVRCVKSND